MPGAWTIIWMALPLVLLAAGLAVAIALCREWLFSLFSGAQGERCTFEGNGYLLSRGEAAFYRALVLAAGDEFVVMAKVRLGDVVCAKSPSRAAWMRASNRLRQKHLDFVLLDGRDLRIRMAVELDDKSHDREDRMERDRFVDDVLRQAGIPVLRVRAAAGYGVADLQARLRQAQPMTA